MNYPSVFVSAYALPINSTITIHLKPIYIKHACYTKRNARPLLLSVVELYLPPLHERQRPPFRLKICHTAPLVFALPPGAKNLQLLLSQARALHKKKLSAFIVPERSARVCASSQRKKRNLMDRTRTCAADANRFLVDLLNHSDTTSV